MTDIYHKNSRPAKRKVVASNNNLYIKFSVYDVFLEPKD